jgi:hypothetical protein
VAGASFRAMTALCDVPGCDQAAVGALPMLRGMTLTIDGIGFQGESFRVCVEHAPLVARELDAALTGARQRHDARVNFAPGDAEWERTFDRDE